MDLTKLEAGPGFPLDIDSLAVRKPTTDEVIVVRKEPILRRTRVVLHRSRYWLVSSDACEKLRGRLKLYEAVLVASRNGGLFVSLFDAKNPSAMQALEVARQGWATVSWVKKNRAYAAKAVDNPPPLPEWPDADAETLLSEAFGDRIIENADDPRIAEILNPEKAEAA